MELRHQYGLNEGDVLTMLDIGGGLLLLVPRVSRVARLGDEVARLLDESRVELETVLETLDQEREACYREHHAQA